MRAALGLLGLLVLPMLQGCTLKEECQGCSLHLDVPIPDCIIYDPDAGSLRACPDAGSSEAGD